MFDKQVEFNLFQSKVILCYKNTYIIYKYIYNGMYFFKRAILVDRFLNHIGIHKIFKPLITFGNKKKKRL